MTESLKKRLLECNKLNDFKEICLKNGLVSSDELDEELLKHYGSLGSGGSAYNHEDPRKAFK